MRPLVVAALAEEAAHVAAVEALVTGVGKAIAAARLAERLATGPRPSVVINIGTAGALSPDLGAVVEVEFVTQHDFPYAAIEALAGSVTTRAYRLSASDPPEPVDRVPAGAVAVASGDIFVSDADHARTIAASGAHLVDMESYAYAAVCAAFAVPMRCVKAVSDSADEEAGESWIDSIDRCARDLGAWVSCHIGAG